MIRAPELAWGAWVLNSSVMAKMPISRMAVRAISSITAWTEVIRPPGG